MSRTRDQKLLRHRWSHESALHRSIVSLAYAVFRKIPFRLKYRIGKVLCAKRYTYVLTNADARVVQLNAPLDKLKSGCSRAMYFALFAGPSERLLVVEHTNHRGLAVAMQTLLEEPERRSALICRDLIRTKRWTAVEYVRRVIKERNWFSSVRK